MKTPTAAPFADDQVLSRDRARLLRLAAAVAGKPGDATVAERFAQALAASRAARVLRTAQAPVPAFDDSLPVAREAATLVELIRRHPVVVVAGETGSGKTTQLPKICLAAGRGGAGMIGCTQPRRIAARAVARRVAEELRSPLGGAVGYQVRFTENVGEGTYIKFMTDGILLAEIQSDRWLSKYDTLIIDEAHERSLNIDFLLGYLKQLVRKRPDLKLVVTSATIDTERFARHFDGAPIVSVEGRSFPVEVRYRPFDDADATLPDEDADPAAPPRKRGQRNLSAGGPAPAGQPGRKNVSVPVDRPLAETIVQAADEITREDPHGDMLVFLPGEREIRDAHAALNRRKYRGTEVIPLYARLSARDQDKVFNPGPGRRIVLATNVAETSLTVPRIRYVIDPGLARVKRYSPRGRLDRLHVEPVSQASADQRKGRCGRTSSGICYRLYSEDDYASRPRYTDPEILRASLAGVILRMLVLGLGRVEDFPFIDPPDPRAIADGWQTLAELGAIDAERRLTATGREMSRLPVDPKLARMLVASRDLGVLAPVLVIAAYLGIQDPRERPADAREKADQAHAEFADADSEFVGVLNLWNAYRQAHEDLTQSKLRDWCERRFLGFLRMREWRELHRQLLLATEEMGWAGGQSTFSLADARNAVAPHGKTYSDPGFSPRDAARQRAAAYQKLHRALIAALPAQIGHRTEKGVYDAPRQRRFQLFPGSALAKQPPPWILVATLLDTAKVWGLMAAKIEPDWVIAELPQLLARRHFDPHWSRAQGRVIGSEQVSLFGLVLAPKRPVHYGGLYPVEAREIFVRQGLVPGEADTRAPFLKRNLVTLEKAREEEAKLRRAGLVADEDWQARWYLDRLAADINSIAALDSTYQKLPPEQKKGLEWSLADLLPGEGSEAERFPKYFPLGDVRLALHYRFEPGHPEDGVTLDVPLHLLQALDPSRLGWLVPGLVEEKATALIRGLPKALRRNYVPAPDFARAFAEAHVGGPSGPITMSADSLAGTLSRFLTRATGAPVAALDFDEPGLDPHLRMNLRLAERDGRVLAMSRDLEHLRVRFGADADRAFAERAGERLARSGLLKFPEEAIPRQVAGAAGVPAFPALVDQGDSAGLSVFADAAEAAREHGRGVHRLAQLALADRLRQARRQLPVSPKLALLYAAIEGFTASASLPASASASLPASASAAAVPAHDQLRADIAGAALSAVLAGPMDAVRDAGAFNALVERAGRQLFAEAMARLQLAEAILGAVAELKPRLESPLLGWASGNLDDLKAQLAGLVPPGFLRSTPAEALAELPRYLKALSLRAERALRDPVRDQARMLELKPFADALAAATRSGRIDDPAWQALRWDLEELRVSMFAQELGTRRQVSAKRLSRQLQALT